MIMTSYSDIKQIIIDLMKILSVDKVTAVLIVIIIGLIVFIFKKGVLFENKEEKKERNDIYIKCNLLVAKCMQSLFTEYFPDLGEERIELTSKLELCYNKYIANSFNQLINYIEQVGQVHAGNEDNSEAKELAKKLNEYVDLLFDAMRKNKSLHKNEISEIIKQINNLLYDW